MSIWDADLMKLLILKTEIRRFDGLEVNIRILTCEDGTQVFIDEHKGRMRGAIYCPHIPDFIKDKQQALT